MLEGFQELEVRLVEEEISIERISLLLRSTSDPIMFSRPTIDGRPALAPLVSNLYGSRENIATALGLKRGEVVARLAEAISHPQGYKPSRGDLPMHEEDFDLTRLPILKFFPQDPGRYVTSSVIVARDQKGKINASFHRLLLLGRDSFVVRLVPRDLYKIYQESVSLGKDLEVAICIGAGLPFLLAAATHLPYEVNELQVAESLSPGFKFLELSNGLHVPADSQIVLLGRITRELADEGPFVDITGTEDIVRKQPVIQIDKMMTQKDPVYHTIFPSGSEHRLLMGLPREAAIFQRVSSHLDVKAVRLTDGGSMWLHGLVSISKKSEQDGPLAIRAAIEAHPSMKHVIIVDDDVDVFSDRQVEWAISTRFNASKDLYIFPNQRGSSLDPTSQNSKTTKLALDATAPVGIPRAFRRVTKRED